MINSTTPAARSVAVVLALELVIANAEAEAVARAVQLPPTSAKALRPERLLNVR